MFILIQIRRLDLKIASLLVLFSLHHGISTAYCYSSSGNVAPWSAMIGGLSPFLIGGFRSLLFLGVISCHKISLDMVQIFYIYFLSKPRGVVQFC